MNMSDSDNLINTGLWQSLLWEMFTYLFMPYPFLTTLTYEEVGNSYTEDAGAIFFVNDVLLCIGIFARIYLLTRTIMSVSWYTDPRAQRVCSIYGCDATNNFAIKCMMKVYSHRVLAISLVISVLIFAFNLRLFERPLSESTGQDFNSMINSIWNILITMTTVGYGDLFPKSNVGRLVGILCAFWGVIYVSLFVVALTNMLEFDSPEKKAFMLL